MRKVIGTYHISISDGGIQKVTSLLIERWQEMGYSVVLFTDEQPSERDYYIPKAVHRIVLSQDYDKAKQSVRAKQLYEAITKFGIEFMVYHNWGNPNMSFDRDIFQNRGIPFVLYTHGVFSTFYHDRNVFTPVFVEELRKCDLVLCLTKVSRCFYDKLGIKSELIDNPLEASLQNTERSALIGNNILWIGRLSYEKKPDVAVRIFNEVRKAIPDAKLQMVGTGPEERKLKNLVRELGMQDDVEFCGYQTKTERYYKNASLMLFTSEYEGYSLVLLESKAYGVPSVVFSLPYIPFQEEPEGMVVVPQDDIIKAAKEIINILRDVDYKRTLGEKAASSFERWKSYDFNGVWNDIINRDYSTLDYKPMCGNEILEKQMIELLLEHEEYGYANAIKELKNSLTYRLGEVILKYPKRFYDCFRKALR